MRNTNHVSEKRVIKDLDRQLMTAKIAVADKLHELRQAEAAILSLQERYVQAVLEYARSMGIDPEDTTRKWHFDGSTMKFTEEANGQ